MIGSAVLKFPPSISVQKEPSLPLEWKRDRPGATPIKIASRFLSKEWRHSTSTSESKGDMNLDSYEMNEQLKDISPFVNAKSEPLTTDEILALEREFARIQMDCLTSTPDTNHLFDIPKSRVNDPINTEFEMSTEELPPLFSSETHLFSMNSSINKTYLTQNMAPNQNYPFLKYLPLSLLQSIASYLTFWQSINICLVCKHLNTSLTWYKRPILKQKQQDHSLSSFSDVLSLSYPSLPSFDFETSINEEKHAFKENKTKTLKKKTKSKKHCHKENRNKKFSVEDFLDYEKWIES